MQGKIIALTDPLHIGPIVKSEGQSFSEMRHLFRQQLLPGEKKLTQPEDMERLLEVVTAMHKEESCKAWCWIAPDAADICAYYWMLPYLAKYPGRFLLVNIAGLPFLDENGKLFYPKSFEALPPKELVKARMLARAITPAEMETDTEVWRKLTAENAILRMHEGGKTITSANADYFDTVLLGFCAEQFQKASKIIRQALAKQALPVPDSFLAWRLRVLLSEGRLIAQGSTDKATNEWNIKLPATQ